MPIYRYVSINQTGWDFEKCPVYHEFRLAGAQFSRPKIVRYILFSSIMKFGTARHICCIQCCFVVALCICLLWEPSTLLLRCCFVHVPALRAQYSAASLLLCARACFGSPARCSFVVAISCPCIVACVRGYGVNISILALFWDTLIV